MMASQLSYNNNSYNNIIICILFKNTDQARTKMPEPVKFTTFVLYK